MIITALIVILGAAVLGVAANIFLAGRLKDYNTTKGISVFATTAAAPVVYGPASTLLALFIAFVLFGAAGSYGQAKTAVQAEAAVVDNFFETAEYLPDPSRRRLQRAAVCYARAVAGPEWDAMAKGEQSKVPNNWTGTGHNGIRRNFQQLGPKSSLFAALTAADQKRGDARRDRLTQARPKISSVVTAFMLAGVFATIFFFAVISPRLSPFHILATMFTAGMLLGALFLVFSLDKPFSGVLRIPPTEIRTTADDISSDFIQRYGSRSVRCDDDGNPTGSRAS